MRISYWSSDVCSSDLDRVHDLASFTSPPLTDVQTTLVPPGGATMVEFKVDYPGRYILVDHALSRTEKGLVGFLNVHGEADDTIFQTSEKIDAPSGHVAVAATAGPGFRARLPDRPRRALAPAFPRPPGTTVPARFSHTTT